MSTDVVIAGAGIIGLSAALELAAQGLEVTVLERGEPMREASWAAAGMLAARDPGNPPALGPFAEYSEQLYPEFLSRVGVTFRTSTTEQFEPAHSAPRFLNEWSLDPRDLCTALPRAAAAEGITLRTHAAVTGVECNGTGVRLHTDTEVTEARFFVDCRGAWTCSPPLGLEDAAIRPLKGQILSVALPAGVELAHTLRSHEVYLVPRGNGTVVVGATVEDAGFDKQVQPSAIQALFARACALWPPLTGAEITAAWAGLRPATADGLPIIGKIAPGCFLAGGHGRNGILLAPATARVLRALITGEPLEIDIKPFRAARFAAAAQAARHDNHLTAAL